MSSTTMFPLTVPVRIAVLRPDLAWSSSVAIASSPVCGGRAWCPFGGGFFMPAGSGMYEAPGIGGVLLHVLSVFLKVSCIAGLPSVAVGSFNLPQLHREISD